MENLIEFCEDIYELIMEQPVVGIIVVVFAIYLIAITIIFILMLLSWINFLFRPELAGRGRIIHKREISASNEYGGAITIPAERWVTLRVNEKASSFAVPRKIFNLFNLGDEVKLFYRKGLLGSIKITRIIE